MRAGGAAGTDGEERPRTGHSWSEAEIGSIPVGRGIPSGNLNTGQLLNHLCALSVSPTDQTRPPGKAELSGLIGHAGVLDSQADDCGQRHLTAGHKSGSS